MKSKYTIGLDFGSNSVRALIVDTKDGREIASSVVVYAHGENGILLDASRPDLARQNPLDYLSGLEEATRLAMEEASRESDFDAADVIGLGVDTTGSTPMPIDESGAALVSNPKFENELAAMAWLWKDHTGFAEAEAITRHAESVRPHYVARCGGMYSSEWFWSKIWRCLKENKEAFDAAASWVEIADWIPAVLTGNQAPEKMKRCVCAAGHKAMYHESWGGYPDAEFLEGLEPALVRVRKSLPDQVYNIAEKAGDLSAEWAERLGLTPGIPVAIGALDAHLGAVGSGIKEGTLVKIVGTSTCDIMAAPMTQDLPVIPGLCGIVPESVLPGFHGLEAGQSAVGDIFNWFVNVVQPAGLDHVELTDKAKSLKPGQSGLLALDWNNGNRTILIDQRLTGLMLGMTLHTTPAEMYRALIEATAFGARAIVDRIEEYGVSIDRVINCGGISLKNEMLLQIYADVLNRPMMISSSSQTCALGSAIAGAVVAGSANGGFDNFDDAVSAMTRLNPKVFSPIPENVALYERLYTQYRKVHDSFGIMNHSESLYGVMKELLTIRDESRH